MRGQLSAIIVKELKLLVRDIGALVMLFVLPALFILVLSLALQGPFGSEETDEPVTIYVVNDDTGETGANLLRAIEESGKLHYRTHIANEKITRQRAYEAILAGEVDVAIIIPRDASLAVKFKSDTVLEILVDPAMTRRVALAIKDSIQSFVYGAMLLSCRDSGRECIDALGGVFGGFTEEGAKDLGVLNPNLDKSLRDKGLIVKQKYVTEDGSNQIPNTVQQNVPGWTIFALFWIAQVLSINMIQERLSGAYRRVLVSPISLATYVAGKVIPFFFINLAQAVFMFAIGVYVLPLLGTPQLTLGNITALALITFSISAAAIGFGLLLAAISNTILFVASISAALLIILSVVGGIMVPRVVLPMFLQKASLFVPHGWALIAYQDVIIRGKGVFQVLPSTGVLLLFAAGFSTVGILRLRTLSRNL